MLEITNLDQVLKQLEDWESAVYVMATEVFRGISVRMFHTALEHSPQFSGDFAANWRYSLKQPDVSFDANLFSLPTQKNDPGEYGRRNVVAFHRGSQQAIQHAKTYNAGREMSFKLGDDIFISNSAVHDDPYAKMIWEGKIKFREVNQPMDLVPRLQDLMRSYQVIGKTEARKLAKRAI